MNEDVLTMWAKKENGLLIARTGVNISTFNFENNQVHFCVLTGYKNIVTKFFVDIIQKFKNPVIVILIETDVVYLKPEWLDNEKLIHCYSWNIPFKHNKLSCIPIGLNFRRHYKSLTSFMESNKINENTIHEPEKMVCFNCSLDTSPERKKLKNVIDTKLSSFCEKLEYIKPIEKLVIPSYIEGKINVPITDPKCYTDWVKYKFILSPEGAGFDCHRTWEALMLGCIPIVKSSTINELYEDLPVVVINDWEDLTVDFLNEKYVEIYENKKKNKYNYEKLYLNYWIDKFIKSFNDYVYKIKPLLIKENNIHFITYGDEKYKSSRLRLVEQAKHFNVFSSIKGYDNEMLTEEFKIKYNDILKLRRGGGYWLWKMDIIKQELETMEENDFLVYLDAGCNLNKKGILRFYEYINMFKNTDYGILSFQMIDQPEKYWTTSQIFDYFEVSDTDKTIRDEGQYVGGVLIMRKNDHLREYFRLFKKCVDSDPYLITDKYNPIQKPPFRDNRHDQSISSIVRKKHGSIVVKGDESWKPPFGKGDSMNYPFWATRSRK